MTPKKVLLVARREFLATVGTRGFIIGLLIVPAMIAVAAVIGPRLLMARAPEVRGEVAVIDPTGAVLPELRQTLAPAAIDARRLDAARRALRQVAPAVDSAASEQAARNFNPAPVLTLVEPAAGTSTEQQRQWLISGGDGSRRLAAIVIDADAVALAAAAADYGTYELLVARGLDEASETVLTDGIRQAIVNARLKASRLDPAAIEAAMRVTRPQPILVTEGGEQPARRGFTRALPFILGVLLFVGIMMGGQTLMTATIEEKSSRVVEVLLAAVSPFELMAGKLLGQMGVGLLMLAVYLGLGLMALMSFAMIGLVEPMLVVYLIVFFLISYVLFGALMMAIGAAVNQMAEAQSLMGPVMIMLVLPYVLAPMIARAPNSAFSITVSFIPPVNLFAMMSRLASDAPPPFWQVAVSIVIGLGAAYAAVWFAAKVFRVGLLMHGKPPDFRTLVRWARAA